MSDNATQVPPRDKGFPKMPQEMLGMPTHPRPSPEDRNKPRNGPSIREWEAVLIGKRVIKEDAEDEENVSSTQAPPRDKGFPKMPHRKDRLGMIVNPNLAPEDKMKSRNGPSIREWEAALLGKRVIKEDAEDEENVSPINET